MVERDFLKQQQQQFVKPLKSHHCPIVALHEVFNRLVDVVVFVPELSSQILLMFKEEAILGASGKGVEAEADFPQKIARGHQFCVFFRG